MAEQPAREALAALARELAAPAYDLLIAGEGNVSAVTDRGTLLVTPSGSRLGTMDAASLVEVEPAGLVAALDRPMPDERWLSLIMDSRVRSSAARPTVEVGLHAAIAGLVGDGVIAHTHPTDLLSLLCSGRAGEFATTRLFPDHIVMLGVADAVVPYVDPGRELAAAVRDVMLGHRGRYGEWPRLVLAENHGIFVLGSTPREALERTLMATKAARVFTSGAASGLSVKSVERIAGREDEHYRRGLLR